MKFAPVLIALACLIEVTFAEDATYAIYFPKHIRPGFPIQFVAEILENENPVKVVGQLTSPAGEINYTIEGLLSEGENKMLQFNEVVPLGYTGTTDFEFYVAGIDSVTDDTLFENSTSDIAYERKSLSIFIQTDKAIYKRLQTIKFRAVVTTPDLLPYSGKVTYKLADPNGNVIIQETDAQLMNGVVGSEFTLGRYASLGNWKLSYIALEMEQALLIAVEEYKLPKFEVEIIPDRIFIDPTMSGFAGKVKADFTFGQPVKGTYQLVFERYRYQKWQNNKQVETLPLKSFSGLEGFELPFDFFEEDLGWNEDNRHYPDQLTVTAIVEDKNSLVKLNASITLHLQPTNIKVETIATPSSIKPGLQYVAYFKVAEYDGRLLSDENVRKQLGLNVRVQYVYPYKNGKYVTPVSEYKNATIRADGLVVFAFDAKTDDFMSVAFEVKMNKFPDSYWTSWSAERFKSPSQVFIQVTTNQTDLKVADKAILDVRTTKKMPSYNIMILSRGKIVKKENYSPSTYTNEGKSFKFQYEFAITHEMSPSVLFVVSFVESGGEIVTDSITLGVQSSLANKVTIKTSSARTETGKPVTITVSASPNSFIGLRAIDRSVLLQKEGNDITIDTINEDLEKYRTTSGSHNGPRIFFCYIPMDGTNAKDVFQKSGIIVFTDGYEYLKQAYEPTYILEDELMPVFAQAEEEFAMFDNAESPEILYKKPTQQTNSKSEVKVRKNFPETWIWEHSVIDEDGSRLFSYTLPDTATTWEISSFAVSDVTGLGVTEQNSQIIATRDFFISLELPATIVNGEILSMRTTVYNFFDNDLLVKLEVFENEWYDFVLIGNDTDAAGPVRKFTIPARDGHTVVFPIEFKKSGLARIKVLAESELAGDAVERTLRVKPEGVTVDKSSSALIELSNDESAENVIIDFPVEIPSAAVDGSVHVKVLVSGNIMGNTLSNLGNLLRLPTGCGEQTMLSFAPDVFVSLYLKKIGQLVGEYATKSRSHIQKGYANELRYQLTDGGFSAFEFDEISSTWLTAFVVKSFIAATELNPDYIETKHLDKAIEYMLKRQDKKDGSFKELGEVRHQDMQGGVNSGATMTAYVLISFTEGDMYKDNKKVADAIKLAKDYLENKWKNVDETFTLAIIAYALALSDSPEATKIMDKLNDRVETVNNHKFWKNGQSDEKHCGDESYVCTIDERNKASSSDIEITSYILLAAIKLGDAKSMMPVVRWLTKQRGSFGGYCSTQDTVMAIQALSVFAGIYSDTINDLRLDVTHSVDDAFATHFTVNEDNSIVLQSAEVPFQSGDVKVTGTGVGIADVQVVYQYNILNEPRPDEPFDVNIRVDKKDDGDVLKVLVCSSISPNAVLEETGMYVMTLDMLSGYSVSQQKAMEMNKKAKLVELVDGTLSGYYDKIKKGEEVCLNLNMERFAKISGIKPREIRAFNYYKPDETTMRTYQPPQQQSVCDVCKDACEGCGTGFTAKVSILLLSALYALVAIILQL